MECKLVMTTISTITLLLNLPEAATDVIKIKTSAREREERPDHFGSLQSPSVGTGHYDWAGQEGKSQSPSSGVGRHKWAGHMRRPQLHPQDSFQMSGQESRGKTSK